MLHQFEDRQWHAVWENRLGLAPGELEAIVFSNEDAAIGQATPAEVWYEVGQRFDLTEEELNTLEADFWRGSEWNVDLFDYIRTSLYGRYKLGILSDAWLGIREKTKDWLNYDLFDVIMFSGEEGIRKPHPEMYQRILTRLGVEAEAAIFIDDRVENVEGAQSVGIHGILFSNGIDIAKEINDVGNPTDLY